jgi:F420H(2)-dependent biliverdin reductase
MSDSARELTWPAVAPRLNAERSYWLSTIARDGGPHISPIRGVVVAGVWFFYSERHTVKARNLAADPRVAIHLADCEDVLIVYGRLQDLGLPQTRPDVIAALDAKYSGPADAALLPSADPAFDVLYALEPRSALAWQLSDYEGSQQRWRRSGA